MKDSVSSFFDLTTNEVRVLQTLKERGIVSTSDLTQATGIARPNCYDILNGLIRKGLASKIKRNNKVRYKINTVDHEALVEQRIERLNEVKKDLKSLNKQAEAALSQADHKLDLSLFTGEEGLRKILSKTYETTKITSFGAEGILEKEYTTIWNTWIRKLQKEGISLQVVYSKRYQEDREANPIDLVDARYIDREYFTTVTTQVLDNAVHFYIWEPQLIAIAVNSKAFSENYREEFKTMWEAADYS